MRRLNDVGKDMPYCDFLFMLNSKGNLIHLHFY